MSVEMVNGLTLFFIAPEGPALGSEQDALDLLGETYGTETDMLVVPAGRFTPEFFDLSTRLAGHFFQKLQNYQMRLAILGDISDHLARSKPLNDFVGETNRNGHHLFVDSREDLVARLGRGH